MTLDERDARLTEICTQAIADKVFPGCSVGFIREGERRVLAFGQIRYGDGQPAVNPDTLYDAASVTKSVPTSSIMLSLIERGLMSLDMPVIKFIPELKTKYREAILIRHLLTYTVIFDIPGGFGQMAQSDPPHALLNLFRCELKAAPGSQYFYTNPPALLASLVIERVLGTSLDIIANEMFFEPLDMRNTSFLGKRRYRGRSQFAPSEIDFRGEVKGRIHDESAWVLSQRGQLTGHAGIFTTAPDLLKFADMLLAGGTYDGRRYFEPETITMMHTNQLADLGESVGLGWQISAPSFMGSFASPSTFGKTGFRSCMIAVDPQQKAAVTHTSNGNYPHRPASDEGIIRVRQAIADAVFAP